MEYLGKALAAACGEVRDGMAADVLGGTDVADGGVVPAFVASPASTEEAAAVMRIAAGHELAVVARGSGSRLGWGTPASRCDLLIDMSRMAAVTEHAAGDLVARVQAGARMGDVAAALGGAGQEIALDVPAGATVGGVVASGLAGPRRLRYGTPRDLLIGITIVRADGTVARSGGKVVKNVAGYDLGKLMAGSAGTLALITEATFRLHPLPAARAYVTAEYATPTGACDAVAVAANSPLTASAVELRRDAPGRPVRVGVLLEGSAAGVAARAARMAELLGKAEIAQAPPDWWPSALETDGGQTLIQVSFWVSALATVLDASDAAARASGSSPAMWGPAGAGVLYIRLQGAPASRAPGSNGTGPGSADPGSAGPGRADQGRADSTWADDAALFVGALRRALAGVRGGVRVLAAPAPVRDALAAEGGMAGTVPALFLMRAVKDQFDPGHRMAPGRFPEAM